jgi:hypothetical protein
VPACLQMRVSKWVDRLQKQFYGTSFAYDKAIRTEVSLSWGVLVAVGFIIQSSLR